MRLNVGLALASAMEPNCGHPPHLMQDRGAALDLPPRLRQRHLGRVGCHEEPDVANMDATEYAFSRAGGERHTELATGSAYACKQTLNQVRHYVIPARLNCILRGSFAHR